MKRQALLESHKPTGSRNVRFTSGRLGLLAAAAAASITALAISACGSGGNGRTAATSPPTSSSGQPAAIGVANTATSAGSSTTRSAAPCTCCRRIWGRRARARAVALPPGRRSGSPVSRSSAAGWPPPRSERPPSRTASHKSPTTGTRSTSTRANQNPGDTNGQGLTAFGAAWFALSPAGNMVSGTGSNKSGSFGY